MSELPNSHHALIRNLSALRGRVAVLGVQDARLLPALAGVDAGLAMTDQAGVHDALRAAAGEARVWQTAFGYDDVGLATAAWDTVVVFLPKARAELDLRLALAASLAASGARLMLIGEKREGIAGAIKQLRAFAPDAAKLDSARHCQVWVASAPASPSPFQVDDWLQWDTVARPAAPEEGFVVAGLPGVFSLGRLDEGTALLLDSLAKFPLLAGPTLDFACGAGVIGAWLHRHEQARGMSPRPVDGLDVQAQAVFCARQTYQRHGVSGELLAADGLDGLAARRRWSAVVTNPPFHTGVKTDLSMSERFLASVRSHLAPGGELRVVANAFLPYEAALQQQFGQVERLLETRKFIVYRAFRRR
ncbi:methyltransferase [Marinobacter sp. C2H3]|uniref:methyltransferase n=1 Tax=Marinobacter sp. C2H3 TaxID=3119003 RepID=UPI00300E87D1